MPILQLVYLSEPTVAFSAADLAQLLVKARAKNHRLGITGMLLYQSLKFLQVLEGEEPAVRSLLGQITADPRHHGLSVLHQSISARRDFPDWSMGFRNLDTAQPISAGFSPFLESTLSADQFAVDPPRAKALLLAFKAGVEPNEAA